MPSYIYKAVTENGQIVRNRVEDVSRLSLMKKLKRNNLTPITIVQSTIKRKNDTKKQRKNIKEADRIIRHVDTAEIMDKNYEKQQNGIRAKINLYLSRSQKIKQTDLQIFTQNFYLLKKANFNNIHALSTIIDNTENLVLRDILEDVLAGVEAGENIYSTMEYYSNVFPYIYVNMIKIGELSGSLTTALFQASKYLEESADINRKLRSILIPNIIQFVVLMVLLIGGTLIAIPTIQDIFDSVGTKDELPAITLWFSDFVNAVIANWFIPTIIILGIIIAIVLYTRTPRGRYKFDYFKYTMPIFGKLIYAIDLSRFMRAVLLNIQNGMRIQDALEVSKNVSQNLVLLSIIETSMNNILVGQSWIEPFEKSGLSSTMITEMLKIGMQTDLSEMMEKLLEYMEIDIDNIMGKIIKVLPQVVYSIVGVLLIFFVLVVLVPLIQVYMGGFLFSAYGY